MRSAATGRGTSRALPRCAGRDDRAEPARQGGHRDVGRGRPTGTDRVDVALGDAPGSAQLHIWRDADSDRGASLLENVSGEAKLSIDVEVRTLDSVCDDLGLVPDLLKLDLQGGELAALRGATQALEHTELMMIEFGCLEAYVGRTTPRDLIDIMFDHDYCLYDLVDVHYRPYDGALTGGDFIFVKNSSALRAYKGWE